MYQTHKTSITGFCWDDSNPSLQVNLSKELTIFWYLFLSKYCKDIIQIIILQSKYVHIYRDFVVTSNENH